MQDAALEENREEGENLFLTFQLGTGAFAIAIDYVSEIVQLQAIIPVPQQQAYMKGVMNLRGEIIPVLDLKQRLRGEETQPTARTCIIVIRIGADSAGMMVDNVSEVVNIPEADISPVTGSSMGANGYVCAMAKQEGSVKMILDCGAVLGQEPFQMDGAALLTEG